MTSIDESSGGDHYRLEPSKRMLGDAEKVRVTVVQIDDKVNLRSIEIK